MPTMTVTRQTDIDAPLDRVTPLILHFEHWPSWNPWLCQEPEAELAFSGTPGEIGSGYSWNGVRVGAGSIALAGFSESHIDCELHFLKPFKSQASVRFELTALGADSCRVAWRMHSSLPFFMFFMRKPFEAYIGADYRRGLSMLKEMAERGAVDSRVSIEGIEALPETRYIALEGRGRLADLGEVMAEQFQALDRALAERDIAPSGPHFCHYTAMDPVADHWEFRCAVPVDDEVSLPGFVPGQRPAHRRCAHLRHTGAYHHLGNAWATAFSWIRADKLHQRKKLGCYEVYLDSPHQATAERRTDIYVPIK